MIARGLQRRSSCLLVAHALAFIVAAPASAGDLRRTRPRVPAAELERRGSTALFATALEPLGEWIELADRRAAWRPAGVSRDWRPYANGSWSWTAAGWYWVTEEPWGWATYHYGRWQLDARLGWIWLPGDTWAPAWVVWRRGGGAVGWAPMPDETDAAVLPASWTFLPARAFAAAGDAASGPAEPAPRIPALLVDSRRAGPPAAPTTAPSPTPRDAVVIEPATHAAPAGALASGSPPGRASPRRTRDAGR